MNSSRDSRASGAPPPGTPAARHGERFRGTGTKWTQDDARRWWTERGPQLRAQRQWPLEPSASWSVTREGNPTIEVHHADRHAEHEQA